MERFIKLSFMFILLISINVEAQWFSQNSSVTGSLNKVFFINQNRGWIVGDYGIILYTSDGGSHWGKQTSNLTNPLLSISFCDELNGWAVGDNGIILKTTNQGNDWIRVYNDTSKNVRNLKVVCISPNNIIVLRDWFTGDFYQDTKIWKTTDAGKTWQDISPYSSWFRFITDISFISSKNIWACGVGGDINGYQIHNTKDGGLNWSTKHFNSPSNWSIKKIIFNDSTNGWATDWDTLYCTSDAGNSWNVAGIPKFNDLTGIVMFGKIGYASRLIGKIKKTTDSGNSWSEQSSAPDNFITDIEFIDENIGWAIGWNGMIYKTINGGITSVNAKMNIPKSFKLYQNYPNPFNPKTIINYQIQSSAYIKIIVSDILGKKIEILFEGYKDAGYHEIEFDGSKYSTGIYMYSIINTEGIISKKMILLK